MSKTSKSKKSAASSSGKRSGGGQSPVSRSGRFSSGPAADVAAFSESISFDWRLWRHDILGSQAHAMMLCKIGVLTSKELKQILKGLDEIGAEIEAGTFSWKPELEDVHMNIESELTKRYPAGAKLHTGRSRNDQVALDVRMWLREEITQLEAEVTALQATMVGMAEHNQHVILPGYTHMQRGQPVSFAHHMLAYVEMLERDRTRLNDCYWRLNECPLGSGALAGSTLPLDRAYVAKLLRFEDEAGRPRVTRNSMDGVSDRDFAVEFCSVAALIAVHLSRLSEDCILWASSEFKFIKISDGYTTGSSLMPQKKNPDVAELTRGKTGRVVGNLMSLLTLLKGLPMTYNRDLQEDKERLFDSVDTVRACVRLMTGMLANTAVNPETCGAAASDPGIFATDLADYLVKKGMPFREAHHVVGTAVGLAEGRGVTLAELSADDYRVVHPALGADVLELFDLKRAMTRKEMVGAPGPKQVKSEIQRWKKQLSRV